MSFKYNLSIFNSYIFVTKKEYETNYFICIPALASGLLFTNIYYSMIDAKSWGNDIPGLIEAASEYFKAVNTRDFSRIFSPINQVLTGVAFILFAGIYFLFLTLHKTYTSK
ncbi:MAG: hypothetical protein KF825_08555 [Ferruginibacter sp.]|nr:hypothetical protein [Ferruginibacter sp.]